MLIYLLDTDVVSKSSRPNGSNVRRWLASVDDNTLALSALTFFELSRGIEQKRSAGEVAVVAALEDSLDALKAGFSGRILPMDTDTAALWGRTAGAEHKQWMDRGLLATARAAGLIMVTCNSRDMRGRGVEVINPDRNKVGRWDADGVEV